MATLVTVCEGMDVNKSLFAANYLSDKIMEMVCNRLHRPEAVRDFEENSMIAALFTASKLCEIYPPELGDML